MYGVYRMGKNGKEWEGGKYPKDRSKILRCNLFRIFTMFRSDLYDLYEVLHGYLPSVRSLRSKP